MDFDGILLLVERDRERFKNWLETSMNFSLDELRDSYNEWLKHYNDTYQKYKDLEDDDKTKNIALIGARLMYFHDLLNYALHALTAYTVKLQEEYQLLRKQTKTKNVKTNKKVDKSLKSRKQRYVNENKIYRV
ncbi:MAG TPA: hypothetical protein VFW99_02265 [Candidatus Nitrosotalea sp.]|nr:hypothetical protein [Candidatus Nitrosotalea sp.]